MAVGTDVEMKDASPVKQAEKQQNGVTEEAPKDPDLLTLEDVREFVKYIEKSVSTKEPRYMARVTRGIGSVRHRLNINILRRLVQGYIQAPVQSAIRDEILAYLEAGRQNQVLFGKEFRRLVQGYIQAPVQSAIRDEILAYLEAPKEVNGLSPFRPKSGKLSAINVTPEVEVYLHLLVLIHLIDKKKLKEAVICSDRLMQKVSNQNRRTMDIMATKCYFYHSRAYELTNQMEKVRGFFHTRLQTSVLRTDTYGQAALLNLLLRNYLVMFFHTRLQTSVLRTDTYGQAALLNLLLRNYLHFNLIEQADKLVSKSTFPETSSNNEWARFLYYLGVIKAAQLEYSEAHKHLLQALRKAPQHAAVGFKQTVNRLAIVVELLLGDIPDRSVFRTPTMRKTLAPYFQLTQAVRTGNLPRFNEVLSEFGAKFQREETYTLIIRLRHNVIKTGVRMINLSYSRISLMDIAQKLGLDSPEDAEYIVAKAIRDGVIEATIDHEKGYVQSKETGDIYTTREPMAAFHQRITFCLDIHNNSVKAMRFPPKSYNKDLESAEERREREQQELESAKEIADEDFDGFP